MQVGDTIWLLALGSPSSRVTGGWPYLRTGTVLHITAAGGVRYRTDSTPSVTYILHNLASRAEFMFTSEEAAVSSARTTLRRQLRSAQAKAILCDRRSQAFNRKYPNGNESTSSKDNSSSILEGEAGGRRAAHSETGSPILSQEH